MATNGPPGALPSPVNPYRQPWVPPQNFPITLAPLPDYNALINEIARQYGSQTPEEAQATSELAGEVARREAEAQRAQTAFMSGINAPMPEMQPPNVHPAIAALAAANAGMSSVLTGQPETAQIPFATLRENQKQQYNQALQQRAQNLALLQDQYQRAADEAQQMGNLQDSIKYNEKFQRAAQQREKIMDLMKGAVLGGEAAYQETIRGGLDLMAARTMASSKTGSGFEIKWEDWQRAAQAIWDNAAQFKDLKQQRQAIVNGLRRLSPYPMFSPLDYSQWLWAQTDSKGNPVFKRDPQGERAIRDLILWHYKVDVSQGPGPVQRTATPFQLWSQQKGKEVRKMFEPGGSLDDATGGLFSEIGKVISNVTTQVPVDSLGNPIPPSGPRGSKAGGGF